MCAVIAHEELRRGQVFALAGEEFVVTSVDYESVPDDGIVGLRRPYELRVEHKLLSHFLSENPELVLR